MGILWAICAYLATAASAHREHKVHNIVLYPEKHSWCKTTPIKQVVGHPGCAQIEVDNNVCVGACFSYSIPRTVPTAPGEVQPYCDSCQPSSVSWKDVKLVCEGEVGEMNKRVEVIEDCSCLSCPAPPQQHTKPGEEGGSPADVPQLLGLLHRANSTSHANLKHSERLSLLVKMLSEEGEGMGEVHDFISQVAGDDNVALEDQHQIIEIWSQMREQHGEVDMLSALLFEEPTMPTRGGGRPGKAGPWKTEGLPIKVGHKPSSPPTPSAYSENW